MILWMPLPGDMAPTQCHRLILTITPITILRRQLPGHLGWTPNNIPVRFIVTERPIRCSQLMLQEFSTRQFKIRTILQVKRRQYLTIAPVILWILLFGMELLGRPKRTCTPISKEPNTESSSTNLSHSTREMPENLPEKLLRKRWLTSPRTWESLGSVEIYMIKSFSRRTEKDASLTHTLQIEKWNCE